MATNKAIIREQIQLAYGQFLEKNGFNDNIDGRLVDLYIEQSISKLLKLQVISNLKSGNVEVPTSNIATYTLPVASNKVELPTFPISLPLDMGVWSIAPAASPLDYFIPIPKAYSYIYKGLGAENLEGQTGYVVSGSTIRFTKAVTGDVVVELLVSDLSTLGDSDLLPIPPDIESTVILDVLNLISDGRFSQAEMNSKESRQNAN